MRDAFTRGLMAAAANDPDLVLITGDLGFGVLKPFWETYPKQFINAGIAEQSMTGMAAGLAREGRKVITYSIGNFPTLRCLEQIRNDCAYHGLNVKVVCVGGGFVYGPLGMSHHATEDMAVMRAMPGVTVFTPGDPREVEAIVPLMLDTPGTCYLRLGRGGEPLLHDAPLTDYRFPQPVTLRQGKDVALLSAGGILTQTMDAAARLQEMGISAEVVSFPVLKPMDNVAVARLLLKFPHLVTVEEHTVVGGFGSAVCEVAAGLGTGCQVHRMGMQDQYATAVGDQQYLRQTYGLDGASIARQTALWLQYDAEKRLNLF